MREKISALEQHRQRRAEFMLFYERYKEEIEDFRQHSRKGLAIMLFCHRITEVLMSRGDEK